MMETGQQDQHGYVRSALQRKPAAEKGEKNGCKGPLRETKKAPDAAKFQATLQFHVHLLATWGNLKLFSLLI